MNRSQRRAALAESRGRKSWAWERRHITPEQLAKYPAVRRMRAAFVNDFYAVQVYDVATTIGTVVHLAVRAHNGGEPPWRDWQRMKNELVGPEREGVQVCPSVADLVDQADMYHLFVLPLSFELPFGLHRENGLARRDEP